MKAIKGFDANLQCRGFQFQIGETYRHEGEVEACSGGFHAIPEDAHPLSVFNFYAPSGSRFCVVEVDGVMDREGNKVASEILTVGKEIGLRELTLEAVEWVTSRAKHEGPTASGTQGAATASGTQGAATASGDRGVATASGTQGAATASGDRGAATASGTQGAATASGYHSNAHADGYLGMVRGIDGTGLYAVERDTWDGPIISNSCGIVGRNGIKADTWYRCKGGVLVEVSQ